MLRAKKKDFVMELEEVYKASSSVIITHYHGLTVSDLTKLRENLRENGASFKIVKNTLAKIAANNAGFAHNSEMFSGPTAVAYSEDPVAAAKCVAEFAKTNNNLKIVGGIIDNEILDANEVQKIAKMPSLDQLRAQIIGLLLAPETKLVVILQAYAEKV